MKIFRKLSSESKIRFRRDLYYITENLREKNINNFSINKFN